MPASTCRWLALALVALTSGCLLPQPDTPPIGPGVSQNGAGGTAPVAAPAPGGNAGLAPPDSAAGTTTASPAPGPQPSGSPGGSPSPSPSPSGSPSPSPSPSPTGNVATGPIH